MDQIRYKERLYTPGDNSPPKHELVRFNEEVKADWDAIQTRRRELSARLAAINSEQADIKNNFGRVDLRGV